MAPWVGRADVRVEPDSLQVPPASFHFEERVHSRRSGHARPSSAAAWPMWKLRKGSALTPLDFYTFSAVMGVPHAPTGLQMGLSVTFVLRL